jgi:hypothetical protein
VPDQLVSPADGKHDGPGLGSVAQSGSLHAAQIRRREALLAVFAPTDKVQIADIGTDGVTKTHLHDLRVNATPFGPPHQRHDVAAVAVQVEQIRIEMTDP